MKLVCILNSESIKFVDNFIKLNECQVYCFDEMTGQNVRDLLPNSKDISRKFIKKTGFTSGNPFNQIYSYYHNKKIFENLLLDFNDIYFTFENVYVRMFCLSSKAKVSIIFTGVIHDERYSLKLLK